MLVAFRLSAIYSADGASDRMRWYARTDVDASTSGRALNLVIGARPLFQPDAAVIDELDAGRFDGGTDGRLGIL